ncbi:MAG: DNA polymerase III subunit beta, partial [Candidatus Omnitrophica bacterium]|nr:DNA polymerase III subunit beta [Candidatus Omnitrophota bacterium]
MALHLNISRKELLTALTSLQNVTSKKGTIAILSNILIQTGNDMVELTGTDLEVGLRRNVPCEIKSPGSITLPSKKLFEIVRESTADIITLEEKENNWVTISAGSSLYNLAGMPNEEFPEFPDYEKTSLK